MEICVIVFSGIIYARHFMYGILVHEEQEEYFWGINKQDYLKYLMQGLKYLMQGLKYLMQGLKTQFRHALGMCIKETEF